MDFAERRTKRRGQTGYSAGHRLRGHNDGSFPLRTENYGATTMIDTVMQMAGSVGLGLGGLGKSAVENIGRGSQSFRFCWEMG